MSDNWLVANPVRRRNHIPIPVQIEIAAEGGRLGEDKIVASLMLRTESKGYLPVYLTRADVGHLVAGLWEYVDSEARTTLAVETTAKVRDTELLAVLERVFLGRANLRK